LALCDQERNEYIRRHVIQLGHPMLHHVEINVSNLGASHAFWSKILNKLGYEVTAYREEDFTLSNGEDAYLKFVQVKNKYASHKYNRSGVGLNQSCFQGEGQKSR
jgi:catechol 2,3-dioxygenase-like lactoylglutathione lyase family enzyme